MNSSVTQIRALFRFHGAGKELIHKWKYSQVFFIKDLWARLIRKRFPYNTNEFETIIPVPAHFTKILYRGFNQSYEIAKIVSANCKLPVDNSLVTRKRYTKPQSKYSEYTLRSKNISKAFKITANIKNQKILIVDDIITSGSTVNELAKTILNKNEFIKFSVFTLAYAI